MNKKKICCIFNSAPHYRLSIYKLMLKEFHCNFFFCNNPMGSKDIPQIKNEELISGSKGSCIYLLKKSLFYQKGVFKQIMSYDILIIGGLLNSISDWLILIISMVTNKKVYIWTHGWYGRESKIKKLIKKVFFKMADGLILYGNYAKALMIKEGFNPEKLYVIHNSLAYDEQLEIRKNLVNSDVFNQHFKNRFPTIIFIGRLTRVKKLEMIPKAISILQKRNIYCNLVVIGSGDQENKLTKVINDLNINNYVWLFGETYNECEIAKLIYNADVCVSPGNVGLTGIHALSYGTPVITHNKFSMQMPEFEAIIPNVCGDFFEYDNINSLAIQIEKWINRKDRNKIRKSCFKVIDEEWNPKFQIDILRKGLKIN